jgi:Mrp family chromosome partitioning ATPase
MSRNFELMQQAGQEFEATPVREPNPVFSKELEKDRTNGSRFGLGQAAREGALRLVQRIFLQQPQDTPHVVLFTGIDQNDGSSQISLLVAETLKANACGSVCLVEADFRSPSLPSLLGTTNHYGLTDALLKEGPIRSFAKPLPTDNVWLLSSGSLNPDSHNLLNDDRMSARFAELRKEFDYILVVAPPLARYVDAISLGRLSDGVVLVLEENSTRKEAALMAIENLRAAQIQVLGAILN